MFYDFEEFFDFIKVPTIIIFFVAGLMVSCNYIMYKNDSSQIVSS